MTTVTWLSKRLNKISKLDSYIRPTKLNGFIKLDANENMALDRDLIAATALEALKDIDLREYPLEEYDELYRKLATYLGVNKKYLALGSGSDQIMDLLLSTIVKKSCATIFVPTFSYFVNRCKLYGITVKKVPLNRKDNNSMNKSRFLKTAKETNLVYICSPNNPTGNQFDRDVVLEILESLKDHLVIIDEAYVEFGDYSIISQVNKYDNVIVLRTLSKAFGLAGARIGYLAANEQFTEVFRSNIQSPYPLNTMSLKIATLLLAKKNYITQTINLIKRERYRIYQQLKEFKDLNIFRSNANFIFFETYLKYIPILKQLHKEGIRVKAFGNMDGYTGCMRMTIGTSDMNDMFLRSVGTAIKQN
jgi:histidinol-phosphate aminotransferase